MYGKVDPMNIVALVVVPPTLVLVLFVSWWLAAAILAVLLLANVWIVGYRIWQRGRPYTREGMAREQEHRRSHHW